MDKDWKEIFCWFHEHPELGYQEYDTTRKIKEILQKDGIEIVKTGLSTGLIAVVRGSKKGKNVAFRADIDALPIEEQTGLSYTSVHSGIMHACGHDFHITTALAAAERLHEKRKEISGNVFFIFQPAEEVADGAKTVIQTGVLKEVDEYYAFHADPALPTGTIGLKKGTIMAAVDQFKVTIKGKDAHAAMPHLGNNPIPVMAQMMLVLQTSVPQKVPAIHPSVLSFTQICAGNTWNVIPESGFFQGTMRSILFRERKEMKERFFTIVQEFATMNDMQVRIEWHEGPAPIVNDEGLCDTIERIAKKNHFSIKHVETNMISDDFSCYLEANEKAAGMYLKVGTGEGHPLHNSGFTVDIAAIEIAAGLLTDILLEAVR
ncbi:amidohydrolase [Kineothrix sedimenti]|uniref:Amidohydrolase n=1 Tax=Kineothrix sedimenti TaxID=3123317 RepID=A0ABZ3EZ62_9FIRM